MGGKWAGGDGAITAFVGARTFVRRHKNRGSLRLGLKDVGCCGLGVELDGGFLGGGGGDGKNTARYTQEQQSIKQG